MANHFVSGAAGKFAEALGSGLAYGIVVVLSIAVLKFWFFKDDPIFRKTDPVKTCSRDIANNNCIVNIDCRKDEEVAIGGQCVAEESYGQEVHIQNYGIFFADPEEKAPRRFSCAWGGPGANSNRLMVPSVVAFCISKSKFGIQLPMSLKKD